MRTRRCRDAEHRNLPNNPIMTMHDATRGSAQLCRFGSASRAQSVVSINGWNRLNIAARTVPGDYVAGSLGKLHAAR
jgi:hypothetical protein